MSSTAKALLCDIKGKIDNAQRAINHGPEWREVVTALREHLRLSLSNTSGYSRNSSSVDGR